MSKALIYLAIGTVISFLLNYFFMSSQNIWLDFYYALAFGLAWGLAYHLDSPKFALPQKLGISFSAMIILVFAGYIIFGLDKAIPSIIKFSIVFGAYYLLASFKVSKSLRQ